MSATVRRSTQDGQVAARAQTAERATLGARLARFKGVGPGFDFLRIVLAISIVGFHALLLTGNGWVTRSPLWMVEYALVPMFFALSGFLVAASAGRLSLANFLLNRGLRIVPALAVDVAIAALVVGPAVTTASLHGYLADPAFASYFLNAVGWIHYDLPGVFKSDVYASLGSTKVNGSLWTVPYEIICYLLISLFIIVRWMGKGHAILLLVAAMLAAGVCIHQADLLAHLSPLPAKVIGNMFVRRQAQVVAAFLLGVACFIYRDRISYSPAILLASVAIILAGALGLDHSQVEAPEWRVLLLPAIVYVTVFLGLTEIGTPRYFRTGDYSYGIYLYHGPLLQVAIGLFPGLAAVRVYGAAFIFAATLPFVLLVAHLSWHVVEKPVLAMRKRFSFIARERGIASDAAAPRRDHAMAQGSTAEPGGVLTRSAAPSPS